MAQLLNVMCGEHVITDYALFGAVAQMRYTEPVATLDADVLVATPSLCAAKTRCSASSIAW